MTEERETKVRLKIPGESFWGYRYPDLPDNQAEINNHLLSTEYSYGDRVEFDEEGNVTRLVKTKAEVMEEITGSQQTKQEPQTNMEFTLSETMRMAADLAKGKCLESLYDKSWKHKTLSTNTIRNELDEIHESLKDYAVHMRKLYNLLSSQQNQPESKDD